MAEGSAGTLDQRRGAGWCKSAPLGLRFPRSKPKHHCVHSLRPQEKPLIPPSYGSRPRSPQRYPCRAVSFSEGDRSRVFSSSCIDSCLEVQTQIIPVVSDSMVGWARCLILRKMSGLGWAVLPLQYWHPAGWRLVLHRSACKSSVSSGPATVYFTWPPNHCHFLGILGNHRDRLQSFLYTLPCLNCRSAPNYSHSASMTVHMETPMLTQGLLLWEQFNHHLEWHSLSGHKSPGAGTATPAPSITACLPVSPWRGLVIMP